MSNFNFDRPFRIIIAGSREFTDYDMLCSAMDWFIYEMDSIIASCGVEIVSGTALGADRWGERYAIDNHFAIKRFPANWSKYAQGAGFRRNVLMADYADALVAFPLGKSSGTRHMIKVARSMNLTVRYGARCAQEADHYAGEAKPELNFDSLKRVLEEQSL